jgi:signal transduction histidine kinase
MFSVGFTSLRFNNWKMKKFRYMIEGFNDRWIYTQSEQVATFSSLPPGKYKFLLEVQGNNSGWQGMEKPLNITVKPPFWMTWPFILLVLFTAYFVVFLYQRGRSRVMLARQRELEQIIEKRTGELLKKNEELELANQAKDKFFSIVSHDLRSPFSGLIGIIELLNDPESELDEEKKRELMKTTEISAKNTFDFLETLLTWARSQMNQTICNPIESNLSDLLRNNVELKQAAAINKNITLRKHLPEKLDAFFDIEMINTVVRNILSNAIKFTNPGGTVDISLIIKSDEAEVIIADTGIGMSDNDLLNMFDLGKSSRKGTMGERGTGLGLIICKEFIAKNNGKLWVTPNDPKGTVFHFTLPVSKI